MASPESSADTVVGLELRCDLTGADSGSEVES